MPNLNRVFLMGNLTRDPELRYTPSGTAVAQFGIAVNRRWKDRSSNEMREETTFVDIEVWARQAETASEYLSKGRACFIEGRLKLDQWERDGQKRSKLKVVAERVQFLGGRGKGGEGGGRGGGEGGGRRSQGSGARQGGGDEENLDTGGGDIPF